MDYETRRLKDKEILEKAENKIKLFIARGFYGDGDDNRAQREVPIRTLAFAPNYAYECGGYRLSSMVMELVGSPSKGGIVVGVSVDDINKPVKVDDVSVQYIGNPSVKFTEKDYKEVEEALKVFIKKAHIPLVDVHPITSENAHIAISAFTKLREVELLNEIFRH